MGIVRSRLEITRQALQKAGPYLLIEMLLPGGSLVAAILYLYRRRRAKASGASESLVGPLRVFFARVLVAGCLALAGCGGPAVLREARPLESSMPLAEAKDGRIRVAIDTVILRNGPGAWARDAEWDEYLIRIRALSDEPVEIRQVAVFNAFDDRIESRLERGELVDGTREMERRYGDSAKLVGTGEKHRIPLVPFLGAAVVPVVLASATVEYFVRTAQVNSQIQRRRTTLPVALASGAEAKVDLFFPITPQSGRAQVVYADRHGEHRLDIDLEFKR